MICIRELLADSETIIYYNRSSDLVLLQGITLCNTSSSNQQVNFSIVKPGQTSIECALLYGSSIDANKTITFPNKYLLRNEYITTWASTANVISVSIDINESV
jgi:hypothetical protein